jgi:sugar phosphate isomerase/epimerase
MPNHRLPRRDLLRAGAAAALPFVTGPSALAAGHASAPLPPRIGISTLGFHDYTNRALAKELADAGIRIVQLFLNQSDSRYWVYNGRSDVSDVTPARCREIAAAYRSAGIAIHSIGVYTNLIHPDRAERAANLAYFEAMMKIGVAMDVHTFITEAGHYHADGPVPAVAYHFQEEVWKRMVLTGKDLAQRASRYEATVLLEPFFRGFLTSAKRTRLFIEEVDSPRIRALLDPANLLEVDDIEEMFRQLTPSIDALHAKDRKLHVDRGVPAGQGDLNYKKFVTLAARHTPQAPLILEYVGKSDYRQALAHLQSAMAEAGLGPGK